MVFSSIPVVASDYMPHEFKRGVTIDDLGWGLELVSCDNNELTLVSTVNFADVLGNSLTRSELILHDEDPSLFLAQRSILLDKDGNRVIQEYYLGVPIITFNTITQTHRRTDTSTQLNQSVTRWAEGRFTADSRNLRVTVTNARGNVSVSGNARISNQRTTPREVLTMPPFAEVNFSATLTGPIGNSQNTSVTVRVQVNGGSNAN